MKPVGDKRIFLVVGLVAVAILLTAVSLRSNNGPSKVIKTVDEDTGETVLSEPNKIPESFAKESNEIFVLGSPELLQRGVTSQQYQLFKDTLIKYVGDHFSGQYDRVKVLSDGLIGSGNEVKGTLRLGESDNTLGFTLTYSELYFAEVTIIDPTGKIPVFKSGKLSAPEVQEEFEHVD